MLFFSLSGPVRASVVSLILLGAARAAEVDVDPNAAATPHGLDHPGSRQTEPEVFPASDEAAQALLRMKLPAGLSASLFAAEPMLANPVAFNFDERGRIFVAETHRYGSSVLDIRAYMWMLEEDLACRTIEDRSKLIAKRFGPAGVQELSLESELVRLLEDRDGDGKADHSAVYASGFNTPLDGVGSGVLARRGQVWFSNIPSLWRFSGQEKAETREQLSRGYGVRFNFTGHDLHGLIFGPDGKIYFSCGDRGSHVPTREGGVVDVPDTGAVFRCDPDGANLELFAYGLRNPQSLLFTENGDLFTGDNDSDQGDEERLVHLVDGGDSGWRVGYQFAPLGNAGPWNTEKMWHPRHAGQAAYLLAPICNIEDGPSGVAYYPGTGLNASYAGALFITHFKGSIARSGIFTYKLKPQGANYAVADAGPFLTSALPTDVKFGPDGRIYYSDWAEGWPKSHRGRIYAIADVQHSNNSLVKETQRLIAADDTKKTSEELAGLLGHADWRVRLEAQLTLAERGAASFAVLSDVLKQPGSASRARLHATWCLGQLATRSEDAAAAIRGLLSDGDAEVRAQAAKLLGEHHIANSFELLVRGLEDPAARVRFFSAQSLGKIARPDAAKPLLRLLRANNNSDEYLRHAAVMGLVGSRNFDVLAEGAKSDSAAERLGVLLALRRLNRTEIAAFLEDKDPDLVREAALAINDAPVTAALPALALLIAKPSSDAAVMIRAINANFRLGGRENAVALSTYAADGNAPAALRVEALAQLALWPKPPARDRIVGVFRPLEDPTRDSSSVASALRSVLPVLFSANTDESVQLAAIRVIEKFGDQSAAGALIDVVRDAKQSGATRAAALKVLDHFHDAHLDELVAIAGASDAPPLRLAALPVAARLSPEKAFPLLSRLVAQGTVDEQKAAYRILGSIQLAAVDPFLVEELEKLDAGKISPAVQLELVEAAAQRNGSAVTQALAAREAKLGRSGDQLAMFRIALEGGDAPRGRRIFNTQPVMACVRCHNPGTGGGDAGPRLAGIGAKQPRAYLLESVVKPNAAIAPGFDSISVTKRSGDVVVGIVESETTSELRLRDMDGKVVAIKASDIQKREGVPSSMPEIYGTILTKAEIRDVVAYLASLTEPAEDADQPEPLRALRNFAAATAPSP